MRKSELETQVPTKIGRNRERVSEEREEREVGRGGGEKER